MNNTGKPTDPDLGRVERALRETRGVAAQPDNSLSVEVTALGDIVAIRLSDRARLLSADHVVDAITRLHRKALADARKSIEDAIDRARAEDPSPTEPVGTEPRPWRTSIIDRR